jgi:hypothetical protein
MTHISNQGLLPSLRESDQLAWELCRLSRSTPTRTSRIAACEQLGVMSLHEHSLEENVVTVADHQGSFRDLFMMQKSIFRRISCRLDIL